MDSHYEIVYLFYSAKSHHCCDVCDVLYTSWVLNEKLKSYLSYKSQTVFQQTLDLHIVLRWIHHILKSVGN